MHDYQKIQADLRKLLTQLPGCLNANDKLSILEFIDANELGLALESMIDAIHERDGRISNELGDAMLSVAEVMGIGGDLRNRITEIIR